jgi:hypothetical protein
MITLAKSALIAYFLHFIQWKNNYKSLLKITKNKKETLVKFFYQIKFCLHKLFPFIFYHNNKIKAQLLSVIIHIRVHGYN